MAVTVQDPNDIQKQTQAAAQIAIGDINSGNYTGAWNAAEGTASLYGTNTGAQTKDPLLLAMESSQGLQQLDPTKQWNPQSVQGYYTGLEQSAGMRNGNLLGQNPYGLWGSGAAELNGTDANNNIAQEGMTPDVQRFAGARPSQSFLGKYGPDIAMAIGAIAAPEAIGALSGLAGSALGGVTAGSVLGNSMSMVLPDVLGGAAYGAGTGALMGGLTGGNVGKDALLGGIGGGVAGGVGGAFQGLNAATGTNIPGAGLASRYASNQATNAANSAMGTGNNMANGPSMSNIGNLFTTGGGLGGLAGLGASVFSGMGNQAVGNMQQNAYTTAGNAANTQPWNISGAGGMGANFANGQINLNPGVYGNMPGQYAGVGGQSLGQAGMFAGGNLPANVTSGYNNLMGQIGSGQGYAGLGQMGGLGMMNTGANMFGQAGMNYNNAYNTSLNAGLAALNPAIQQQSNALLNSEFLRGQLGTSGGGLQTQALQSSFNTANLQAQQNAVGQGLAAMNTTGNLGLGAFGAGAGQMGNFNNQAVGFGQQGLTAGMNTSMFAPQLTGQYINNANQTGLGGQTINNMGLGMGQFGLAVGANQGNQMNYAARTQGSIANQYNGGLSGYLGSMFGGLSGALNQSNPGGLAGMLSGLFGGNTTATGDQNYGLGPVSMSPNQGYMTMPGGPTGATGGSWNPITDMGSNYNPWGP